MDQFITNRINSINLTLIKIKSFINNTGYEYFLDACMKGDIKFAKWLYEMNIDIDISAENEYAFRFACYYNQIELAKWLLEIKPDINIYAANNSVFTFACFNQRIELAEWLCTLNNLYYVKIENNRIVNWKIKKEIDDMIETNNKEKIIEKLKLNIVKITDTCIICLNDACEEYIQTNCNHIYCYDCYIHWYYIEKNDKRCCYCSLSVV